MKIIKVNLWLYEKINLKRLNPLIIIIKLISFGNPFIISKNYSNLTIKSIGDKVDLMNKTM